MSNDFGRALVELLGERSVSRGEQIDERYRTAIGVQRLARPAFLVKPGTTGEVAAVMRLAHEAGVPVTTAGGRTGTCGGALPSDDGLALSLERMKQVIEIDVLSMTMTVEAGCLLKIAQEAAEAQGAFLPLDLGSRGSAMIGGTIAANAGGNRVIRWGMMRDMVLGLEAVLADGTVVSSLGKMIKDNAGYDWKQLLIGSEGTLGVITRAVLRLRPLPTTRQTALVAARSFEDAIILLRRIEILLSGQLSSFELMWEDFYRLHTDAQLGQRPRPSVRSVARLIPRESSIPGNCSIRAERHRQHNGRSCCISRRPIAAHRSLGALSAAALWFPLSPMLEAPAWKLTSRFKMS